MDLDHDLDDVHPLHPYRNDAEIMAALRRHLLPTPAAFVDMPLDHDLDEEAALRHLRDPGPLYDIDPDPPFRGLRVSADPCPFPFFRLFRWSRRRAA